MLITLINTVKDGKAFETTPLEIARGLEFGSVLVGSAHTGTALV